MTNELYRVLRKAKIIGSYKCSKEDFESADPILRVSDEPEIDGYKLYEEIEDEEELKLLIMANEARNTRSIRSMLIYFTTLSVVSLTAWIILLIIIASLKK